MVVKDGQGVNQDKRIQETPVERDNANLATSFLIPDTQRPRRPEFLNLSNDIGTARKSEFGRPTEFHGVLTNDTKPAYANVGSINECTNMTDRHTVVMRREGLLASADDRNSPQNSMKHQSEYECMSSPDCSSASSSARSSNTDSFYGNISPDTLSLASFAGRLNFGRFGGSKRSSQSSNASSLDSRSSRQSWGKIRDSFDLSDATGPYYVRRDSKEQVYENTRPFTPENLMKFPVIKIGSMDADQDEPPALPLKQNQPVSKPTEQPEMILPYKVVDLEELQRSLEDIEPYYISHEAHDHDANSEVHSDFYNECSDLVDSKDVESEPELPDGDIRPVLPPKKKKNLTHSHSDSCCNSTNAVTPKEKPTPLPRQSVILSDGLRIRDGTVQNTQTTDESADQTERSISTNGHEARQKNLPSGQVSNVRCKSPSPPKTARPVRSAPPPPPLPPRSWSTGDKGPSIRPVSEMFSRSQATNATNSHSPLPLKRSMTVSVLQSPFSRRPVESLCEERSENVVQVSGIPATTIPEPGDEKSKDDTKPKSGVFFGKSKIKKALSTLKIPGTKKAARKELAISAPSDFTSLYQGRFTSDYSNREQKTVSFLATDENDGELNSDSLPAGRFDPAAEVAEDPADDIEEMTIDDDEPMEQLSFHPEFTGLPLGDQLNDHCYYNLPQVLANGDDTERISPKKPPRSGYLMPSLSKRTIEQEEEISQNKVPELGPLPTPPEGGSTPVTPNATPIATPVSGAPTDKCGTSIATPENHVSNVATTTETEDQKVNNGEIEKPLKKRKPEVPNRPKTLKLKPKIPSKPIVQSSGKPTPIPRSLTLDSATIQKSRDSINRKNERRRSTPLEETTGLSRSCDFLDIDDPRDNYLTDMHLIVLKDILRCWRNMLRKPTINLAGACWEDFEVVEVESFSKVSENQGSVSIPVRLRKATSNLDSSKSHAQYIAKVKSKAKAKSSTKSLFDQDYSVCSSVEPHENVSRVLAYFRGEIQSPMLGLEEDTPFHTTISISDQVPSQTCAEFVAQSKDAHSEDPLSYERTVCMLILQCLKGVTHLHDSGFTHGNLNLNSLFLIKHTLDSQLLIRNFEKALPLAKERRASNLHTKYDDAPKSIGFQNDVTAISEILEAMLHQDQNGNGTHTSKAGYSTLSGYLRKASERLRDGSASLHHVIRFLQALLWGPFRLSENIVIVSESRMKQWLDRQRGEFVAKLAMDEAVARTVGKNPRKFSMEDLLLCEYLTSATPNSLVRTEKRWFLAN